MRHIGVVLLAVLLLAAIGFAQTATGGIEGTVTDPSGAVIAGAKVTITEVATGRNIPLTTSAAGRFSVRNLLPGAYNVTVESAGFSKKKIDNIPVSSGQVVNGDTMLEVGKSEQIIEVSAQAVTVDTNRQTVDSVITAKEIQEVPLFSRNFLELAQLAPGTTVRDGETIDPTKAGAYRVVGIGGRSGTATRVQVDGIDVTDETVGTTVANFSQDSVSEFQLTRSSLDPSTSLTSSGAINIISKSGGNTIHGGGFWDYYNQDMGARLGYEPQAEAFSRKRFGVNAGGPLKKDKLFWFVDWERQYMQSQAVSNVPQFPQLSVHQAFPAGIRMADGRLDWNVTQSVRMFAKFHHNWDIQNGGGAVSPFQNLDWTNTITVGFDITKSHWTHSYRFGYVNFNNQIASQELDAFHYLRTPNGIPYYLGVGPYGAGPNNLAPQATYQDNWQNSYEGSHVRGKQTIRFGFDIRHFVQGGFANFAGPLSVSGDYNDTVIAAIKARGGSITDPNEYPFNGLTMGPANGFFTLRPGHNLPHGGKIWNRAGLFVQDSIKATRSLTLNVGVRYTYDTGYFSNDRSVLRDPIMERYGAGYSAFPDPPKNMWSPSLGFAWSPKGNNKTVIRGGFYRAYEMNIINNTMFDEFAMLPAGIGPDSYTESGVTAPNGTPINVDGKHANGDYSDLIGLPIKQVIGTLGQLQSALSAAYANYQFDPKSGTSALRVLQGLTYGGNIPGNAFKPPYSIQANIGMQRELKPGTVISVDYVNYHGVGLPIIIRDFELRKDAATLNVAAATAKINTVLAGKTMDQYLAANPTATMSKFGLLANDSYFTGRYTDLARIRLFQGGYATYRALQVNLRGGQRSLGALKDVGYNISYALGSSRSSCAVTRGEFIAGACNNRNYNDPTYFGPTGLDYTHMATAAVTFKTPGGFRLGSFWIFRTAPPVGVNLPNLGAGIASSSLAYYGTDLEGDGTTGSPLPGLTRNQFGRKVKSLADLNNVIKAYNQSGPGQLTPHGQALVAAGLFTAAQLKALGAVTPTIPLIPESNPNPFHNLFTTDLRVERPIKLAKLREGLEIAPFGDVYNLFNHAPAGTYGGLGTTFGSLNYNYATPGDVAGLNAARGRINGTRRAMIGMRVVF